MYVSVSSEPLISENEHNLQSGVAEILPRVLYIGDLPVESSYHGSALLYRLLEKYTEVGLTIIETGLPSVPARRLLSADYKWSPLANHRLLNTRFHAYVAAFYSCAAKQVSRKLLTFLESVDFDALLTVAHGFGWITAAAAAELKNVPLHLIIHDDWPRVAQVPTVFRDRLDHWFADVYGRAESRTSVSPAMRDEYEQRYGRSSHVLYPMRDRSCPEFNDAPVRLGRIDHQFTVGFAGTINSSGYANALRSLHLALQPVDGRLLIFGPLDQLAAERLGLNLPNVKCCGLLNSSELIQTLREKVDTLFVPMSFSGADALNMKMAFPSKLADYSAVGVPLLIYGPKYCSAVRWAEENLGTAIVVDSSGEDALAKAVRRLVNSPAERVELGRRALQAGRRYFSPALVQDIFDRALRPLQNR